jgi:hypothetical protein
MGFQDEVAPQQICAADVCFGSKADIAGCETNVRFTPKSGFDGHWRAKLCACGN